MKAIITALLLSIIISPVVGQTIKYEKTFEDALKKATAQKKLVFLVINTPPRPGVAFKSGLDTADVVKKYNENFISYQVYINDTASMALRKKYPSTLFPAYFFLDKNGSLIYRDAKNSSSGKRYLIMADDAIKQAASGKNLSDYDAIYKSGKIDAQFLREYITLRQKLGINDNASLIDEYVDYLPVKALNNYQEILFIFKAGPIAYGKAYSLAYINRKIVDSIYKTEPQANRIAMNNAIISNTYMRAVNDKNASLAQQLNGFIRATHSTDYVTGSKIASQYMVSYYYAVKDTANYLQQANYFYDSYYMHISADSAKKLVDKQRENFLRAANKGKSISADSMKKLAAKAHTNIVTTTFSSVSSVQDVSTTLNNAAYNFYLTGTHNPNYLLKAITWSRRSIEMNDVAAYHDTLAHLLYRYGFYAEAESEQNLAINKLGKEGNLTKKFKGELVKIKTRTL